LQGPAALHIVAGARRETTMLRTQARQRFPVPSCGKPRSAAPVPLRSAAAVLAQFAAQDGGDDLLADMFGPAELAATKNQGEGGLDADMYDDCCRRVRLRSL
jgi:hypothetical protein